MQNFHIIIGENHTHSIGIETAEQLINKFKDKTNFTLLFENYYFDRNDLNKFYENQKQFSDVLYDMAVTKHLTYQDLQQYYIKDQNILNQSTINNSILLNLFGRDRVLTYHRLLSNSTTEIHGIDTPNTNYLSSVQYLLIRKHNMAKHLQKFHSAGISTITVVEAMFLDGLYNLLNSKIPNLYFFIVQADALPTLPVDISIMDQLKILFPNPEPIELILQSETASGKNRFSPIEANSPEVTSDFIKLTIDNNPIKNVIDKELYLNSIQSTEINNVQWKKFSPSAQNPYANHDIRFFILKNDTSQSAEIQKKIQEENNLKAVKYTTLLKKHGFSVQLESSFPKNDPVFLVDLTRSTPTL